MAQFLCFSVLFLVLGSCLVGCGNEDNKAKPDSLHVFSEQVMGTAYTVKYLPPGSSGQPLSNEQINQQIHAHLERVDSLMSTYKPASEVSRFNEAPAGQWFDVSPQTFEVMALAERISRQTAGSFDVSVASLVNLWGFGPGDQKATVPEPEQIKLQLAMVGYQNIELDEVGTRLRKKTKLKVDLSAIAKGYAVDQVADYLDNLGVVSYLVEVGGELRTRGTKPDGQAWRIAIESPQVFPRDVHAIVDVTDRAVATSGDYRNYFEKGGQRYSHTIDPQTGYPITHRLASVTVVGKSAAEVDALATAFSVMGTAQAMQYAKAYNVAAYFIVKEKEGFVVKASEAFIAMNQVAL